MVEKFWVIGLTFLFARVVDFPVHETRCSTYMYTRPHMYANIYDIYKCVYINKPFLPTSTIDLYDLPTDGNDISLVTVTKTNERRGISGVASLITYRGGVQSSARVIKYVLHSRH